MTRSLILGWGRLAVKLESGERCGKRSNFGNDKRVERKIENVWQLKDLESFVFVSVAGKGVTNAFLGCVANKRVKGNSG